ncbi:haloacid dehalogenase [Roseomonas gilardii]|uniref:Haloacid dehalogenase n=1 Tax=Roseomonas gilardii TaxID=257708 RepID=A0A1L7AMZ3_9PROT|nr:HAD family hydrolase [Roseomonas gilardii]APT60094.1 haloacid dehalogenase [Roseomonas gilardii]
MNRPPSLSRRGLGALALGAGLATTTGTMAQVADDPLPSWREGPLKKAILDFVQAVTTEGSPDFVPLPERIAVFDNDGTLWCEIPTVQLVFALDRVKALAPKHPDWSKRQPFRGALEGDMAGVMSAGQKGLIELVMATHAGMSTQDFARIVSDWIGTARHPKFQRPFTRTIYQPMLEVLALLRNRSFTPFIVSGGGVEFMRAITESVYGIPPEQVIGSTIRTEFRIAPDGRPELIRLPAMDFIDDGPGKPVAINKFIGRRPIAAFGNSDGDLQMLQYVTAESGRRFGLIVHHDDAVREVAYDRKSPFGRLDKALDLAPKAGWSVVSMRDEWKRIFPDD